jgi:hypothetical protein
MSRTFARRTAGGSSSMSFTRRAAGGSSSMKLKDPRFHSFEGHKVEEVEGAPFSLIRPPLRPREVEAPDYRDGLRCPTASMLPSLSRNRAASSPEPLLACRAFASPPHHPALSMNRTSIAEPSKVGPSSVTAKPSSSRALTPTLP